MNDVKNETMPTLKKNDNCVQQLKVLSISSFRDENELNRDKKKRCSKKCFQ